MIIIINLSDIYNNSIDYEISRRSTMYRSPWY